MFDNNRNLLISITNQRDSYQFSPHHEKDILKCLQNQVNALIRGEVTEVRICRKGRQAVQIASHVGVEEDARISALQELYEVELLREQILLFDREEEMLNYIQTEKLLAQDSTGQLAGLCFCLLKLSKELMSERRPLIGLRLKQDTYSKQKLERIQSECMNTLLRVKEQRRRVQNCCICLSNKSTMIILPCMHLVVCERCVSCYLEKCPICLQLIQNIRQVYQ